jgi:hypothetical protein
MKLLLETKMQLIKNALPVIVEISDILANVECISVSDLADYSDKINVESMLNDWYNYGISTYNNLQVSNNKTMVSIVALNATIFLHSFVEKFLK